MQMLADTVKAALIPGSVFFLLLGLILGVVLLHSASRAARWGRRWLTALALLYCVLGMPIVSNVLVQTLQAEHTRLQKPSDALGARVVVVIGAGVVSYAADGRAIHEVGRRTAYAVLEAARVYHLITASWVIASGGIPDSASQTAPESEVMRDELIRLGVPPDRILLESESRNTAEQVTNITRILRHEQLPSPVVVVTTPAQSRRVMLLAARQNLEAVPSVTTDLRYDRGQKGWRLWRPGLEALRGSESAMYEYLAVAYAWLRR
jgi:uncharacterized SAM-binding protein YcdF (DUF218 family)